MAERGQNASYAGAAPLLLVAVYFLLVASFPGVDPAALAGLSWIYAKASASLLLVVLLVAFGIVLVSRLARGELSERPLSLGLRLLRERWAADRGLSLLVPPLLFTLLLTAFNAYKQLILPPAGFALDPVFAAWDRALFLGRDPWLVLHDLLPGAEAARYVSLGYHQMFAPMALGVFLASVLPVRPELRTQYLLSYALIWILIGSVFAYLLPSAGPVFWGDFHAGPDPFAALVERLAAFDRAILAGGHADGLSAYHFQRALADSFGSGDLLMGRGISAMPSVHNALAVQFACAAFAVSRPAGWVAAAYALFVWLGSIHLGWHYAVDGIAAALIAVPLWYACGRWARLLHRAARATVPRAATSPAG